MPVAPDTSNMIPARLTGLPFWDLYLYRKIPIWEAYIRCAKHFDFDSLMDGYFPLRFPFETVEQEEGWEPYIVLENPERIVTRSARRRGVAGRAGGGLLEWSPRVDVYYVADPPTRGLAASALGMGEEPEAYRPVEGVREVDTGPEGFARVKELLGDQGLVGAFVTSTIAFGNESDVYRYYDNPELHERWAAERI